MPGWHEVDLNTHHHVRGTKQHKLMREYSVLQEQSNPLAMDLVAIAHTNTDFWKVRPKQTSGELNINPNLQSDCH